MRIEINPRSLLNLEHICEVLYKLHPSVLAYLVEMQRNWGKLFGFIDFNNISLGEREILTNIVQKLDFSNEPKETEETEETEETNEKNKLLSTIRKLKEDENCYRFNELRKYLKLDTYEYIPMQIYVEVEDPDIGRNVKELVEALEKTGAPQEFTLNKKEIDEDAYFAEGYGLTLNEEQEKQRDDFLRGKDVEGLEELLRKEKLYP